jgi:hypothetical protein
MATIIAGRFEQQAQVQDVIGALQNAGFPEDQISSFYVNPPGQHDTYQIGGDRDKSPGAEDSSKGAATGGAVGAAIGIATTPVTGPAGPALGAYVGSLIGTLSQMDEAEESPPVRQSGMLVAVSVPDGQHEAHATDVLRALGAHDLERADGTIENGDWIDFNPVSTPTLLNQQTQQPTGRTGVDV